MAAAQSDSNHLHEEHAAEPLPQSAETRPPAEVHPNHARRVAAITVAFIIVVSVVVVILLMPGVATDDAQVAAHVPTISPRVDGYVTRVLVNDNQLVTAGETLVELDPKDYAASAAQAKAAYMVAEAEADEAQANIRLTRDSTNTSVAASRAQRQSSVATLARSRTEYLQSATALLGEAQANLAAKETVNVRAQTDLRRYQTLLATQDVSRFQFDSIATTAHVAQADVTTAQKQVLAAEQAAEIAKAQASSEESALARADAGLDDSIVQRQQVPIREDAYESARAAAERAQATLDEAMLKLSYTRIVSPMDGQVTQRSVETGQFVAPGQQLMTIVPLQNVYITANFKETQLAHVRQGQRVKIHADEYRGITFWGTVNSIAGSTGSEQALLPPQNATGNFVKVVQRIPVKILVDKQKSGGPVLRPGMNVEVTIDVR